VVLTFLLRKVASFSRVPISKDWFIPEVDLERFVAVQADTFDEAKRSSRDPEGGGWAQFIFSQTLPPLFRQLQTL
jgi:hypothetical protein